MGKGNGKEYEAKLNNCSLLFAFRFQEEDGDGPKAFLFGFGLCNANED
jgi:hypothetical protein